MQIVVRSSRSPRGPATLRAHEARKHGSLTQLEARSSGITAASGCVNVEPCLRSGERRAGVTDNPSASDGGSPCGRIAQ